MRPVTSEELQQLLACTDDTCISIYLPTEGQHEDAAQNPIRYKKLVSRAEELLAGSDIPDAQSLLAPMKELATAALWRSPGAGLAVFRSASISCHYRLPVRVPELSVVSRSFHVKPLVAFLHSNRKFFLLAVSRNHVTLYQGTPHSLVPVDLAGLPKNLREALGVEEKAKQLSSHSGAPGQSVFHGQGAAESDRQDDVSRFFRAIDKALWSYLRNERVPLVLAGVKEYHPLYHGVSRYPYLLDHGVEGNVDRANATEIHAKAWPLVADEFRGQESEIIDTYHESAARKRATDDLGEIGRAAVLGRVRTLLLERGKQVWGVVHRDTGQIDLRDLQSDVDDADVLDTLAEIVLGCDGMVIVLDRDRMPTDSHLAAVFRY